MELKQICCWHFWLVSQVFLFLSFFFIKIHFLATEKSCRMKKNHFYGGFLIKHRKIFECLKGFILHLKKSSFSFHDNDDKWWHKRFLSTLFFRNSFSLSISFSFVKSSAFFLTSLMFTFRHYLSHSLSISHSLASIPFSITKLAYISFNRTACGFVFT